MKGKNYHCFAGAIGEIVPAVYGTRILDLRTSSRSLAQSGKIVEQLTEHFDQNLLGSGLNPSAPLLECTIQDGAF